VSSGWGWCVDWWTFTDVSGRLFFRLRIRQTQDYWTAERKERTVPYQNVGGIFVSLHGTEDFDIKEQSVFVEIA
jgi:hypothetical protein